MNKIIKTLVSLIAVICFMACGNNAAATNKNKVETNGKTLVVYFSVPFVRTGINGDDDSTVEINGKKLGNTEYFAKVIQENTGADIYRIEPKTPYPLDFNTLRDIVINEQKTNARPELKNPIPDLSVYETIFIGAPVWSYDMPYILYSFYDKVDLSGKKVILFGTHGGSGFAGAPEKVAQLEPKAEISPDNLTISRDEIQNSEGDIIKWLENLGYKK